MSVSSSAPPGLADPAVAAVLEAARRAARGGMPRSVLLLHLSAIVAPRPHHARVARAILADVAQRQEGEVLRLKSGDLVLLCCRRPGAEPAGPDDPGPNGLPAVLNRLFAATARPGTRLFSVWHLPGDIIMLHAALLQQQDAAGAALRKTAPVADPLEYVGALLDFSQLPDLMQRQTAIRLRPGAGGGIGASGRAMEPCFREITFSIEALERRIGGHGLAASDPLVFRHLTARLDGRMLSALTRQLKGSGPLVAVRHEDAPGLRLHVNLSLGGILSVPFQQLATICQAADIGLGVEISYVEACADQQAFTRAASRLREANAALILDGVSASALQLTRLATLNPDLVKLDWHPALEQLAPLALARLQAALYDAGLERLVLHRAETEAALRWGVAQGITMFQGRHVDAMLGARRFMACQHAAACALRECIDRAAAIGSGGRAGCQDMARLDAASFRQPAHVPA